MSNCEHQPLLRIHGDGLRWRDAKELSIEHVSVDNNATKSCCPGILRTLQHGIHVPTQERQRRDPICNSQTGEDLTRRARRLATNHSHPTGAGLDGWQRICKCIAWDSRRILDETLYKGLHRRVVKQQRRRQALLQNIFKLRMNRDGTNRGEARRCERIRVIHCQRSEV